MEKEKMNVLSLFDGMSCGQIALERAGIRVENYYASEIDKYAIQVTQHNYPDTIQIGSVTEVSVADLEPIDMLIGGSPCQSFSFAGKRNGMTTSCSEEIYTLERYLELRQDGFQFEGESYLFWEYMRILTDIRKYNPDVLFLLENVEMGAKWERVLSEAIGIYGVHINSALVSAQNRKRIYWTNIRVREEGLFGELQSDIPQPEDRGILLKDILEDEVDEKYYLSDKMLNYFNGNSKKMKDAGNGFSFSPTIGDKKAKAVTTRCGNRMEDEYIIVIPEATSKGYVEIEPGECFDAENINSKTRRGRKMVNKSNCLMAKETDFMRYEAVGCDYRADEGFRFRNNGKSGTLQARARNDESCGQLASIGTRIRRLTPLECERLQTVTDNYTTCVSDTQRYKMLGNGWTINVIKHIFSFLK